MVAHITPSRKPVEAKLVSHTDSHWDIARASYEQGHLDIEFRDGCRGRLPVSLFPALAAATEADFADLEVSPCGLLLENERVEWDYAEAGLYQLVQGQVIDSGSPDAGADTQPALNT